MKNNNIIRVNDKYVLRPLSEYNKALVIEERYNTMSYEYIKDLVVEKVISTIIEQVGKSNIRNVLIKANHQEFNPDTLNKIREIARAVKKEKIKIYTLDYLGKDSLLQKMMNDYYHYCSIDVDSIFMLRGIYGPRQYRKLVPFDKLALALTLQQNIETKIISMDDFNLMLKDNNIDINKLNKADKNSIYLSYVIYMGFYSLGTKLEANILPKFDFDTYMSRIKKHIDSSKDIFKAMQDIKEAGGFIDLPKMWDDSSKELDKQKDIMLSAFKVEVSGVELEINYKHQLDSLIGKPNGLRSDLLYIIKDKTLSDVFYKNNELEFSSYDIYSIGETQELNLINTETHHWYAMKRAASDSYLIANLKHPNKEYLVIVIKRKSDEKNFTFAVLKDLDISSSIMNKHSDADNLSEKKQTQALTPEEKLLTTTKLNFMEAIDNLSTVLKIAVYGCVKKDSNLLLEFFPASRDCIHVHLKYKEDNKIIFSFGISNKDSISIMEMFKDIDINGIEINRSEYAYANGLDILLKVDDLQIEQAINGFDDLSIIKYTFSKLAENIGILTLQRESNRTLTLKMGGFFRGQKYPAINLKLKPMDQNKVSELENIKFLGPVSLKIDTAIGVNNFIKEFSGRNTSDAIYILNMTYEQAFPFSTYEKCFTEGFRVKAIEVDGLLNNEKYWYIFNFPTTPNNLRFKVKETNKNFLMIKVYRNSDNMEFIFALNKKEDKEWKKKIEGY